MPDIYVSISTIPGREHSLSNTLISLALQNTRPTHVYICICETYTRFPGRVELDKIFTPIVRRYTSLYKLSVSVVISPDYGSCTKAIGSQAHIPDDAFVLLMDDDAYYKPHIISEFFKIADEHHAYSFDVEEIPGFPGVLSGKGIDGFMIHTSHLRGLKSHYERLVADEPSWNFQDDLLISLYLRSKGVPIIDMRPWIGYCSYIVTEDVHTNQQMHIECNYEDIYSKIRASYGRLGI